MSAAHVPKPGETDCSACHVAAGKVSPAKCLVCHTEIASRIAAQKGYHRDKADDCAVCHAEHQGRQANIVPLEPASFDHAETDADWHGSRYSDGTFFNQISARFRFDLINRPGQGWTLTLDARDRVGIRGTATNQAILYNARLTFDKAGSPFHLSLGQMNLYDTAGIGALLGAETLRSFISTMPGTFRSAPSSGSAGASRHRSNTAGSSNSV